MNSSEVVQWWEEWQLRILVLSSLFLQCFLFIAAALRKRCIHPFFKFLTWISYLASDAVAIYALATLFNRHKKQNWVSMRHSNTKYLEALWAPILLLLHLGGQDGITAYNIEDNELWRRHVLTALSQITVAVYVFCKTWSGDKRLFQATILLFVPGILKCLEKPWALYRASINSMAENLGSSFPMGSGGTIRGGGAIGSLREYVDAAVKYVNDKEGQPSYKVNGEPYKLFVDLSYSYQRRLEDLKYMVRRRAEAHKLVRSGLSATFDRIYTKHQVYKTLRGNLTRIAVIYLPFAAIGLFHNCLREDYSRTDVNVTYILLCGTAAVEFASIAFQPYLRYYMAKKVLGAETTKGPPGTAQAPVEPTGDNNTVVVPAQVAHQQPAQEEVDPTQMGQYNLIGFTMRNSKYGWVRGLASHLYCKDHLDRLWSMPSCDSSQGITDLVHSYVTKGWECYIENIDTYRRFNDNRGQWTLQRHGLLPSLSWSLTRPFDESVLIWHLATDFCFHHVDAGPPADQAVASRCREMSNYMAYLLFAKPEMLVPGARHGLFTAGYQMLQYGMVMWKRNPRGDGGGRSRATSSHGGDGQQKLARKIIRMLESVEAEDDYTRLIHKAWELARKLMGSGAERKGKLSEEQKQKMWAVIQGVWVEMLCFSASRCRGFLHAKSLGDGGEYLSYVWLLLCYMGMETMAERLRRTKLVEEGDIDTAVQPRRAATKSLGDQDAGSSQPPTGDQATEADQATKPSLLGPKRFSLPGRHIFSPRAPRSSPAATAVPTGDDNA